MSRDHPSIRRWVDRILALLLASGMAWIDFGAIFLKPESDNTIAYSLPAANLVTRGSLGVPQLGSQFGLDRAWLLNSPMMAMAQAPLFAAFGVSRWVDLGGLFVVGLVTSTIIIVAIRRALDLEGWALPVFLGYAILGDRLIFGELHNQRYSLIGFGLMTLAFWPCRAQVRPGWQWLVVASLPLVHPGLIPAWGFWLAVEGARWLTGSGKPSKVGVGAVGIGLILAVAWYGRVEAFRAQFLPHLRFGNFRSGQRLAGILSIPASPIFAIPSQATNLGFVLLAWGLVVSAAVPSIRRRLEMVLVPAGLVAVVSMWDLTRGFAYDPFYYLGVGPCLLVGIRGGEKRLAVVILAGLAAANLAISSRLDFYPPCLSDTPATARFVVDHTRAGDRIVVGPPFVLVASTNLPGGRRVAFVSPNPYFLEGFDESAFREEVRSGTDVYVGSEAWYNKQVGLHVAASVARPIFPGGEVERFTFDGRAVVVVRALRKSPE